MAFFTHCSAKTDSLLVRLAVLICAWLALAQPLHAAEGVGVQLAEIRAIPEGYELSAQFVINPSRTLEEALEKGVALHFLAELEVMRPRSWWFNESVGEASRRMRIYYNFLLRRYVIDSGYTTLTAATLDEALAVLGRVEHWQVLDRGTLKTGQRYEARLRFKMDASQLAKPLQMGAIASGKWDLQSGWYEWKFDAPLPVKPAPRPVD